MAAMLATGLARAEDWTTTDGQAYHSVKVLSHDDTYVTVMDSDGGARIPLRTLQPDLQKRFGYDATKAAAQEAATAAADKRDRDALIAQQTAARQAPVPAPAIAPASTVQPTSPAVSQGPAVPETPTMTHGPSAPPSKKPAVDTFANSQKIAEDKKALEDLEIDMRDAQRQQQREFYSNYHYDYDGSAHPNTIGESGGDQLSRLNKKKKQLEEEIRQLQAENAAAGQPST